MEWPERVKTMQRNWIGRSEGLEVDFGLDVPGVEQKAIRVFTTRPDTIFGVTFMVLAPEHPLVDADHDARPQGGGRGLRRAGAQSDGDRAH